MAARKGIITFGLVSIPVGRQPAARPLAIGAMTRKSNVTTVGCLSAGRREPLTVGERAA
jgi:hypothetical protein